MPETQATIQWDPAPGKLFARPETDTDIGYAIRASVVAGAVPPAPTIEGYSANVTPQQSVLNVTAGNDAIRVTAASLAGLFAIDHITYRKNNALHTINAWDQLPADGEIIAFRPGTQQSATYTLTATAQLSDSTQASATYGLTIYHDWSGGRQRLVDAINARR